MFWDVIRCYSLRARAKATENKVRNILKEEEKLAKGIKIIVIIKEGRT